MQRRFILDLSLKNKSLLFGFSLNNSNVIVGAYKSNLRKRFAIFLYTFPKLLSLSNIRTILFLNSLSICKAIAYISPDPSITPLTSIVNVLVAIAISK
jgi:hypothetical protein